MNLCKSCCWRCLRLSWSCAAGAGRTASRFARWTLLCLGAVVVWRLHLAGGSGVQGSLGAQRYIFLPPVEQWSEKTLNSTTSRAIKGRQPDRAVISGSSAQFDCVSTCTTVLQISSVRWCYAWPSTSSAARMR